MLPFEALSAMVFMQSVESRSGVSKIRSSEADWCNVFGTYHTADPYSPIIDWLIGAGLGMRPSTDTGNSLIDASVPFYNSFSH